MTSRYQPRDGCSEPTLPAATSVNGAREPPGTARTDGGGARGRRGDGGLFP